MASLSEFNRRMQRRGNNLVKAVDRIVREVAIVVDRQIVLATPVDTGRARANWLVTVGAPTTAEVPVPESGDATASAIAAGEAAIAGRVTGQVIYIQNNVPYIGELNDGSSAQAPANFVAKAVIQGARIVQKAKGLTDGN